MLETITVEFGARGETLQRVLADIEALPAHSEARHLAMAGLYAALSQLETRDAERARMRDINRSKRATAAKKPAAQG